MSIPISDVVKINPGVQSPAANALTLNSVILTKSTKIAAGTVTAFTSALAVRNIFGIDTVEDKMATRYFSGYDGSTIKPSLLYFAPFNDTARAAWLRSGSWAGKLLADIRAVGSGTLTVVVNGASFTSATINLSTAGSFSDAASKISAGFSGGGAPVCTWDAVSSTFVISSPTTGATTSVAYATDTLAPLLLLTQATGASLSPGASADSISGAMEMIKAATQNWVFFSTVWEPTYAQKKLFSEWANSQNSRYGYVVWDSSTAAFSNLVLSPVYLSPSTSLTYSACSFGLALTGPQGAKLSPSVIRTAGGFTVSCRIIGASGSGKKVIAAQPGCFEISKLSGGLLISATYGSVTLTGSQVVSAAEAHVELSVSETGGWLFYNGVIVATSTTGATAAGCSYAGDFQIGYSAAPVTDGFSGSIFDVGVFSGALHTSSTTFTPPTTPLTGEEANLLAAWSLNGNLNPTNISYGEYASTVDYDGVMAVYNNYDVAAFALGMLASIDFNRPNSRITAKFKKQSGLLPTVTDKTQADKLIAKGYNFYGQYSENNISDNFFHDGQMFGKWKFIDLFANQVYLNAQLQGAALNLLTSTPSIGYTQSDFSLIKSAMQSPINDGLSFGSIRAGVILSESQKATLNQSAGLDIATTIQNQGYYLQILDPGAQVRAARGSPIINFWYTDGGAVHKLNVSSVDII